ncbi:MAG TPA: CPP1-like family protein [Leptolyngbyaceae cyanobacterium]
MNAENPYKQLGLNEDATFEEIQTARNRLTQEHSSDPKRQETIETAYDAILMERLRMRQEGKIKVPEGIRFAERLSEAPPSTSPTPVKQTPTWLQGLLDTPSRGDILWPAGIFLCLAALSFYNASVALAAGVLVSLYFLTRKENKLGRAMLMSLLALITGLAFSAALNPLLQTQINLIPLTVERFAACITFIILWLVTSFLR